MASKQTSGDILRGPLAASSVQQRLAHVCSTIPRPSVCSRTKKLAHMGRGVFLVRDRVHLYDIMALAICLFRS
jgi:hypothetical protein